MNATMYANANDGYVRGGAPSYATARSTGSVVESAAVGTIVATTTESPGYRVYRAFHSFDLSGVMGFISSAKLGIRGASFIGKNEADAGSADLYVYEGTQADTQTTDDFNEFGSTLFGSIDYEDFSTSGYNDIPLNDSGLVYLRGKLGGNAKFCFRVSGDVNNITPTGNNGMSWYSADQAGTDVDPYLYVEYVSASGLVRHQYIPALRGQ